MNEIILVKNGELALKGLNRGTFEDTLIRNIRWRLKKLGKFEIKKAQSTIYITPKSEEIDLDDVCERMEKIFGIAAFSRCLVTKKDMQEIERDAVPYLREILSGAKTFKVAAKRADKTFVHKSPEIQSVIGGILLDAYPHLKVDVHHPEVTVTVEIRDFAAYVHARVIKGAGGLPIPCSGEGMLLVSGGIDSPVAGYMMARRGMRISAVHFISPPYTSDRALLKVLTLLEKMAAFAGDITFYCVPFTKIQETIKDRCPEDFFTIIMRRMMMRIAMAIAKQKEIPALITGESLGQVASQTVYALSATDAVSDLPVMRPLIGMDKEDIVRIAREIDTFETSILPYEDCCTVFTPKHPKTKPVLSQVEAAEQGIDFDSLLSTAVEKMDIKIIGECE